MAVTKQLLNEEREERIMTSKGEASYRYAPHLRSVGHSILSPSQSGKCAFHAQHPRYDISGELESQPGSQTHLGTMDNNDL